MYHLRALFFYVSYRRRDRIFYMVIQDTRCLKGINTLSWWGVSCDSMALREIPGGDL